MKKTIVALCFAIQSSLLTAQTIAPKQPEFKGFFVGAMTYTDIYPKFNPIIQLNFGASFKTKSLFFDIVPIQISYTGKQVYFGTSILYRRYLFRNK